MIKTGTRLVVADNSGANIAECIKVLGGSKRKSASVGDVIVVAIKKSIPGAKAKKGSVYKAVVVRSRYPSRRIDGARIRFDDNAVVIIDKNTPVGTRVFNSVSRDLREKISDSRPYVADILSRAEEVL